MLAPWTALDDMESELPRVPKLDTRITMVDDSLTGTRKC